MAGLDITPIIPAGRQVIEGYGGGGFRVSGRRYEGSIFIRPERTNVWSGTEPEALSAEMLLDAIGDDGSVRVLIIGCGERFSIAPQGLAAALRARGCVLEWMNTGAACRTYNVLLSEDRGVAALIIAVD